MPLHRTWNFFVIFLIKRTFNFFFYKILNTTEIHTHNCNISNSNEDIQPDNIVIYYTSQV
jgi:hypothetical protein